MLRCRRSRSQCRSTLMSSCNAALGSDLLFSCAHFGVWVLRPTGPRCGSLGRSPAQPDVGLGALAKHGPQGLKGRANSLARPDGASVFSWSIVPGVAPGAPLQRRPCSTPGFHSAPPSGLLPFTIRHSALTPVLVAAGGGAVSHVAGELAVDLPRQIEENECCYGMRSTPDSRRLTKRRLHP